MRHVYKGARRRSLSLPPALKPQAVAAVSGYARHRRTSPCGGRCPPPMRIVGKMIPLAACAIGVVCPLCAPPARPLGGLRPVHAVCCLRRAAPLGRSLCGCIRIALRAMLRKRRVFNITSIVRQSFRVRSAPAPLCLKWVLCLIRSLACCDDTPCGRFPLRAGMSCGGRLLGCGQRHVAQDASRGAAPPVCFPLRCASPLAVLRPCCHCAPPPLSAVRPPPSLPLQALLLWGAHLLPPRPPPVGGSPATHPA